MSSFFKAYPIVKESFKSFRLRCPSLVPLLAIIISISLYLNHLEGVLLVPFIAVLLGDRRAITFFFTLVLLGWGAFNLIHKDPHLDKPLPGRAKIHIQTMSQSSGMFGQNWVYKGVIKEYRGQNGRVLRRLPFTLYLPSKMKSVKGDKDYWVEGELKPGSFYGFSLKVKNGAIFTPIAKSYSLVQWRYELKQKLEVLFSKKSPFKNGRMVLLGMATADFQDLFLSFTFARFGLNHLLTISGFHFALLTLFLNMILRIFPLKIRLLALACTLTAFYLFVGYGPSLERAWIVAMVYILSTYFYRLSSAINILLTSMLIILVMNPFMLTHLGFQFSFGVTFAILAYYKPCENWLKKVLSQNAYFEGIVIKAIALGIVVHLAALPITLYHFHKFYWMGFIYNLIIPFLIGLLLLGFMAGLLINLISPILGGYCLYVDSYFMEVIMKGIFWIPTNLDYALRIPYFPKSCLILYLFLFVISYSFFCYKNEKVLIKDII